MNGWVIFAIGVGVGMFLGYFIPGVLMLIAYFSQGQRGPGS